MILRSSLRRRRPLLATAGVIAVASVMVPSAATAHPSQLATSFHHNPRGCPAAENLVTGTKFTKHTLAPGIVESAGKTTDDGGNGVVVMHVLRVDLTRKTTSVQPLVHHLAHVAKLTSLSKGHPKLVAVSNTGYFDLFATGAPTLPLISHGAALILAAQHQPVVGFTTAHRIESGHVWLAGSVTVGQGQSQSTYGLSSVNDYNPPSGLAIYTAKWGPTPVPAVDEGDLSRTVVKGALGAAGDNPDQVPTGGSLLVAHGSAARSWLAGLATAAKVTTSMTVKTTAALPFAQAYGVGVTLVAKHGVAKTGFTCRWSSPQPARTSIGYANGGKTMVIAFVSDDPQTPEHGLDNDQMSSLMVQLGVDRAFNFDGSGSTELLAKLHASSTLALQTHPADGHERLMPLGLGVAYKPVLKPKATAKPKAKKKG
jgi:hypothetical protein